MNSSNEKKVENVEEEKKEPAAQVLSDDDDWMGNMSPGFLEDMVHDVTPEPKKPKHISFEND